MRDWGNDSLHTQDNPFTHHVLISHHFDSLMVRIHPRETCWLVSLDMGGISLPPPLSWYRLISFWFSLCQNFLSLSIKSPEGNEPTIIPSRCGTDPGTKELKEFLNALIVWSLLHSQATQNLGGSFSCVSKTVELSHGKWNWEVLSLTSSLSVYNCSQVEGF